MTAIAAAVSPKRTSGRSTWRATNNVRRASKLDRQTRQTNCSNIFRWYRAGWGRYTESDPLGLGPDINVYRYANSSPINIDDPLGLDTAGCDEIGKYAVNETPCRAECCAQHDRCYDVNHCSAGSWPDSKPKTPCDTAPGCRKCNDDVKDCFKKCLRKELFGTKDDPKKPNYYCGAQHRFIRIPGDFANIAAAKKSVRM